MSLSMFVNARHETGQIPGMQQRQRVFFKESNNYTAVITRKVHLKKQNFTYNNWLE